MFRKIHLSQSGVKEGSQHNRMLSETTDSSNINIPSMQIYSKARTPYSGRMHDRAIRCGTSSNRIRVLPTGGIHGGSASVSKPSAPRAGSSCCESGTQQNQ